MAGVGINIDDLGGLFSGVGSLAKDLREAITGEISPEKKAEIETKLLELEQQSANAQTQINLADAQSGSLFRGGWRPFTGWICALGFGYQFLFYPLFAQVLKIVSLDASILATLLMGLLGLGGMRSYDKKYGVVK